MGTASPRQQRYGSNAADVVELRATADSRFLYLLARFNFLNAADSTVLGLAFDTDGDRATGSGEWPHGAQVHTPGADVFLTAHGTCALLNGPGGEHSLDAAGGAIRVDTAENVMEFAVPRAALGSAPRLGMAGGAGLWDPAEGTWMVPTTESGDVNSSDRPIGAETADDPAVFNLLFRDNEGMRQSGRRTFQANRQHAVLADGTTGAYAATLDMNRIGQPSFSTCPGKPRTSARSAANIQIIAGSSSDKANATSEYLSRQASPDTAERVGCVAVSVSPGACSISECWLRRSSWRHVWCGSTRSRSTMYSTGM